MSGRTSRLIRCHLGLSIAIVTMLWHLPQVEVLARGAEARKERVQAMSQLLSKLKQAAPTPLSSLLFVPARG
jgi:hypothetical protein